MDIQKEREAFLAHMRSIGSAGFMFELDDDGNFDDMSMAYAWSAWQVAKAQAVPEGFALVSQKDLLELTIAINAVDLATHTESKTNEVREMWQQVALKLMALGTTQEPKFNLDEFLTMEEKLKHKGGVITADLDRFIAYAEMVLEKAKAIKEPK